MKPSLRLPYTIISEDQCAQLDDTIELLREIASDAALSAELRDRLDRLADSLDEAISSVCAAEARLARAALERWERW